MLSCFRAFRVEADEDLTRWSTKDNNCTISARHTHTLYKNRDQSEKCANFRFLSLPPKPLLHQLDHVPRFYLLLKEPQIITTKN